MERLLGSLPYEYEYRQAGLCLLSRAGRINLELLRRVRSERIALLGVILDVRCYRVSCLGTQNILSMLGCGQRRKTFMATSLIDGILPLPGSSLVLCGYLAQFWNLTL